MVPRSPIQGRRPCPPDLPTHDLGPHLIIATRGTTGPMHCGMPILGCSVLPSVTAHSSRSVWPLTTQEASAARGPHVDHGQNRQIRSQVIRSSASGCSSAAPGWKPLLHGHGAPSPPRLPQVCPCPKAPPRPSSAETRHVKRSVRAVRCRTGGSSLPRTPSAMPQRAPGCTGKSNRSDTPACGGRRAHMQHALCAVDTSVDDGSRLGRGFPTQ